MSHVTNQSYFVKRMIDNGYNIEKLNIRYAFADPRDWTVVIDPGCASVFCTLYRNANPDNIKESQLGEFYFELYDGGQFLPSNLKYKTNSMDVIIEYLIKHGINNKSVKYLEKCNNTINNSKEG